MRLNRETFPRFGKPGTWATPRFADLRVSVLTVVLKNISANCYCNPSEKICSAQNRIIFSNIFRWWKKNLTRIPSRELTYSLPRRHLLENGVSFSRLVAYVSSLTEVPSAFRSSNEISRLQGARHGRHHNKLSCTEDLASPFFMRLDTGVSQKLSMFQTLHQDLYPLSAFEHARCFQL